MERKSQDKKPSGTKRFLNSFKYSFDGLSYAYKNEQSLWIHAVCSILAIILGIIFKITLTEWIITIIIIGVALSIELINSAIEATVDLATKDINPLAKASKDCGSASSLIMSVVALIVALLIYVPYIINLIMG